MNESLSIERRVRRRWTRKQIAKILLDHQRSGLTLSAFARKRRLCYGSLLRWRAWERQGVPVGKSSDLEADPQFVPVKLENEGMSGDYVLSWPNGRCLKIPLQFEAGSLQRLLGVLEGGI